MNVIESDSADAGKQHDVQLQDSFEGDTLSLDKRCVPVLLDISEEDEWREQDIHESQIQTGWEDAVEGWARSPPHAVFQAYRKGKRIKQDISESHCVLCADLKISDLPNSSPAEIAIKPSYPTSEDHFKNTSPSLLDLVKKPHSNASSSASSDELPSFSPPQESMKSGPIVNKSLSGDEQCTHNKSPSVCHHQKAPCPMLKERVVGKVALTINSFSVLPPVKVSRNLRSSNLFKRRERTDWHSVEEELTESSGERVAVNGHKVNIEVLSDFISDENSYQGSPISNPLPSLYSNQLLPAFNFTLPNNDDLLSSIVADTLPQSTYLLDRTRPSPRINSSYRSHSGHKASVLRRPEPQHLMLLGTRVPILPLIAQVPSPGTQQLSRRL